NQKNVDYGVLPYDAVLEKSAVSGWKVEFLVGGSSITSIPIVDITTRHSVTVRITPPSSVATGQREEFEISARRLKAGVYENTKTTVTLIYVVTKSGDGVCDLEETAAGGIDCKPEKFECVLDVTDATGGTVKRCEKTEDSGVRFSAKFNDAFLAANTDVKADDYSLIACDKDATETECISGYNSDPGNCGFNKPAVSPTNYNDVTTSGGRVTTVTGDWTQKKCVAAVLGRDGDGIFSNMLSKCADFSRNYYLLAVDRAGGYASIRSTNTYSFQCPSLNAKYIKGIINRLESARSGFEKNQESLTIDNRRSGIDAEIKAQNALCIDTYTVMINEINKRIPALRGFITNPSFSAANEFYFNDLNTFLDKYLTADEKMQRNADHTDGKSLLLLWDRKFGILDDTDLSSYLPKTKFDACFAGAEGLLYIDTDATKTKFIVETIPTGESTTLQVIVNKRGVATYYGKVSCEITKPDNVNVKETVELDYSDSKCVLINVEKAFEISVSAGGVAGSMSAVCTVYGSLASDCSGVTEHDTATIRSRVYKNEFIVSEINGYNAVCRDNDGAAIPATIPCLVKLDSEFRNHPQYDVGDFTCAACSIKKKGDTAWTACTTPKRVAGREITTFDCTAPGPGVYELKGYVLNNANCKPASGYAENENGKKTPSDVRCSGPGDGEVTPEANEECDSSAPARLRTDCERVAARCNNGKTGDITSVTCPAGKCVFSIYSCNKATNCGATCNAGETASQVVNSVTNDANNIRSCTYTKTCDSSCVLTGTACDLDALSITITPAAPDVTQSITIMIDNPNSLTLSNSRLTIDGTVETLTGFSVTKTAGSLRIGVHTAVFTATDSTSNTYSVTKKFTVAAEPQICDNDNDCDTDETETSCSNDCPGKTCALTSANWADDKDTTITQAVAGDDVWLMVEGNNCRLNRATFDIKEWDSLDPDNTAGPSPKEFTEPGSVKQKWTALWQRDEFTELGNNDPEYYFIATARGTTVDNNVVVKLLRVRQAASTDTCTARGGVDICRRSEDCNNGRVFGAYGLTGTQVCCSVPCSGVPTISFVPPTPDNGENVAAGSVTIKIQLNRDAQRAVLELTYPDKTKEQYDMRGSSASYEFTKSLTALNKYDYTVTIISADGRDTASRWFNVVNPSIGIQVTGTATDPTRTATLTTTPNIPVRCSYTVTTTTEGITPPIISADTDFSVSKIKSITDLQPAAYTLNAACKDRFDNSFSASTGFGVDRPSARFSLSASHAPTSPNNAQDVTITATAAPSGGADLNTVLDKIEIYVDGKLEKPCPGAANNPCIWTKKYVAGQYTYYVKGYDKNSADFQTTPTTFTVRAKDTTPPVISDVRVTDITGTSATITFTTDDEATPRVDYRLQQTAAPNLLYGSAGTSHSIIISGLSPGTMYYYKPCATNVDGVDACDSFSTFTTTATTLTSITITPSTTTIIAGATQSYTVTARYSDGTSPTVTTGVILASDPADIVSINELTVTGVSAGTTTITASYGGQTATATLTVTNCGNKICDEGETEASCPRSSGGDCPGTCDQPISAIWADASGNKISNAAEGDDVWLVVGGTNCGLNRVNFDIKEKNLVDNSFDDYRPDPSQATFTVPDSAKVKWKVVYGTGDNEFDAGVGNYDLEYYYIASSGGKTAESDVLTVSKPSQTCAGRNGYLCRTGECLGDALGATDAAGQVCCSVPCAGQPRISFVPPTPENGETIAVGKVIIQVGLNKDATDAFLDLTYPGYTVPRPIQMSGSGTSFSITETLSTLGRYTYNAKVRSADGEETSGQREFTVVQPSIGIQVAGTATDTTRTATLTTTPNIPVQCDYTVTTTTSGVTPPTIPSDTDFSISKTKSITDLQPAAYTLNAACSDRFGNEFSAAGEFGVAPVARFTLMVSQTSNPNPTVSDDVTITSTASDITNLDRIEIYVDN
ncbi:MAG: fibronectin type III domain-containing protein, partial [Candidatus Aenigmarchaeota archaeon]|nr:fibronectin type III domain-containing protein [Candidatus Aenigmarchaeota archaeon]